MSNRNSEAEFTDQDLEDLGSDDGLSQLTDHTIDLGVEGIDEDSSAFSEDESEDINQNYETIQSLPKPNKKAKMEQHSLTLEQALLKTLTSEGRPETKKPKLSKPKISKVPKQTKVGKAGKQMNLSTLKQELYERPILPATSKPNFPFENFNSAVNSGGKRLLLPANSTLTGLPILPTQETDSKPTSSPQPSQSQIVDDESNYEPEQEVKQQYDFNLALIDKLLDNSRKVMGLLQVTPMNEEEIWATFPEFMNREDMKLNADTNVAIPPPMLPDPWFERSNVQLIKHYCMLGKELKACSRLTKVCRSYTALSTLAKITDFIVDNLELLGLTGAHHPVEVDRVNLWRSLNSCWFFALAKSKFCSAPEEQVTLDLLKQLRVDLLKWGDALSPHGLVNYSVGLNEAELIDAIDIVIAYYKVKEGVETPPKVEMDGNGNPTPLPRDSDDDENKDIDVNQTLMDRLVAHAPHLFQATTNCDTESNEEPTVDKDTTATTATIHSTLPLTTEEATGDDSINFEVNTTQANGEKLPKGSETYNNLFDKFINVEN